MNDLEERRATIDKIDAQIIDLLAQRKAEVEGIIAIKMQSGLAAHQPARFEAVVERCRAQATTENLDPDFVESIWQLMHKYFLQLEKDALEN